MAFEKIKQMLSNVKGRMTDDKGLFQGGDYARPFGRVRDAMWDTTQFKPERMAGNLESTLGMESGTLDRNDPRIGRDFEMARTGAATFNPQDPNDVLMMQKRINRLLPEGNRLSEDSMFGPKTESALKMVQGMMTDEGGEAGGLMSFLPENLRNETYAGMNQEPDSYQQPAEPHLSQEPQAAEPSSSYAGNIYDAASKMSGQDPLPWHPFKK